jgi:hypothetical protein
MLLSADLKVAAVTGGKTVTVVDLQVEAAIKSFEVEEELTAAFPADAKTLYASARSNLLVISVPKQAVVSRLAWGGGEVLFPTPDGRKLYAGGGSLLLPKEKGEAPAWCPARRGNAEAMQISPDGRFGVGASGNVYRLSKNPAVDQLVCGKVEPNLAVLFLPKSGRVLVFTAQRFLKIYDVATWELMSSTPFGCSVYAAVADEDRKLLYVFGTQAPGGAPQSRHRTAPVGDLFKLPLP